MPNDLKLSLRITVDGNEIPAEVGVSTDQLKRMGLATDRASQASRVFRRSLVALRGPLTALAGGLTVRALVRQADAWTSITNRVRLATDSQSEFNFAQDELFDLAQRTRAPLEASADLYNKLSISSDELNASQSQILDVIEGVNQSLVINGRSAAQSSGAILQLTQALGGGIVRAEEFNSLLEGALPLLQVVARHMDGVGGSVARLRQRVNDGEVSSREFFAALEKGLPDLDRQFARTTIRVSSGIRQVENSMVRLIGTLNEELGATVGVTGLLGALAGKIDDLTDAVRLLTAEDLENEFDNIGTAATVLSLLVGGRLLKGMNAARKASNITARSLFTLRGAAVAGRVGLAGLAGFLGNPFVAALVLGGIAIHQLVTASDEIPDSEREIQLAMKMSRREARLLSGAHRDLAKAREEGGPVDDAFLELAKQEEVLERFQAAYDAAAAPLRNINESANPETHRQALGPERLAELTEALRLAGIDLLHQRQIVEDANDALDDAFNGPGEDRAATAPRPPPQQGGAVDPGQKPGAGPACGVAGRPCHRAATA